MVIGIFFIAERCNRWEDKKERGDGTIWGKLLFISQDYLSVTTVLSRMINGAKKMYFMLITACFCVLRLSLKQCVRLRNGDDYKVSYCNLEWYSEKINLDKFDAKGKYIFVKLLLHVTFFNVQQNVIKRTPRFT